MIIDFLKKYQEELITDKIQLKEDIDLLDTKIKEEKKFIALLEETNESYFSDFSPRDLNEKNNKKAEEIRSSLNDLESIQQENTSMMKFYDSRLQEVNSLISNYSANNIYSTPSMTSTISSQDINISSNGTSDNDLSVKLNNVKNLILLDPFRASLEIDNIINSLR